MRVFEKAAFVFIAVLFPTASCLTGQSNVSTVANSAEETTSPSKKISCFCSECPMSGGNNYCSANRGCFSARQRDQTVKRGCFDGEIHEMTICPHILVNCCHKNWCNSWNNTPPFITEPPISSSKRIHLSEQDQSLGFILLSIFSPLAVLVLFNDTQ